MVASRGLRRSARKSSVPHPTHDGSPLPNARTDRRRAARLGAARARPVEADPRLLDAVLGGVHRAGRARALDRSRSLQPAARHAGVRRGGGGGDLGAPHPRSPLAGDPLPDRARQLVLAPPGARGDRVRLGGGVRVPPLPDAPGDRIDGPRAHRRAALGDDRGGGVPAGQPVSPRHVHLHRDPHRRARPAQLPRPPDAAPGRGAAPRPALGRAVAGSAHAASPALPLQHPQHRLQPHRARPPRGAARARQAGRAAAPRPEVPRAGGHAAGRARLRAGLPGHRPRALRRPAPAGGAHRSRAGGRTGPHPDPPAAAGERGGARSLRHSRGGPHRRGGGAPGRDARAAHQRQRPRPPGRGGGGRCGTRQHPGAPGGDVRRRGGSARDGRGGRGRGGGGGASVPPGRGAAVG